MKNFEKICNNLIKWREHPSCLSLNESIEFNYEEAYITHQAMQHMEIRWFHHQKLFLCRGDRVGNPVRN